VSRHGQAPRPRSAAATLGATTQLASPLSALALALDRLDRLHDATGRPLAAGPRPSATRHGHPRPASTAATEPAANSTDLDTRVGLSGLAARASTATADSRFAVREARLPGHSARALPEPGPVAAPLAGLGPDDELAERFTSLLRREARRHGVDVTGTAT